MGSETGLPAMSRTPGSAELSRRGSCISGTVLSVSTRPEIALYAKYLAAAIYRREVFRTVGLFDEELGIGEDTEWFNRAQEHGLKLRQVDQVTLLIRHPESSMIRGKSLRELNSLKVLKDALDRKRAEILSGGKDVSSSIEIGKQRARRRD